MKKYYTEVFDNIVPDDLRREVWNYIQQQSFHATRKDVPYPQPGTIINYIPENDKKEYLQEGPAVNNQYMHRCVFGKVDTDLDMYHPTIFKLWETINAHFDNKFEIQGDLEGIADDKFKMARVYVNAQPSETIKRTHGIHRDTINLHETRNFTLLYMANLEWYPSWFAENMFFYDDDTTGDNQQYQKGNGQSRGFGMGYSYATIHPEPGRVVLYDGRALHTTKPTASWSPQMRYAVVFRLKEKAVE